MRRARIISSVVFERANLAFHAPLAGPGVARGAHVARAAARL